MKNIKLWVSITHKFVCEFGEIFQNNVFADHSRVTVSDKCVQRTFFYVSSPFLRTGSALTQDIKRKMTTCHPPEFYQ